jgi:predicted dehydrogenase
LNISWCASGEELAIHGTEGSVVYQDNRWVTVRSVRRYEGLSFCYEPAAEARFDCPARPLNDAFQPFNQHRLFLEAVRDGTPPFVSLEDGLRDLAVVEAFYRALRTESTVAVDLMVGELLPTE